MKELHYKEARELILQGKKIARNFNLKVYVYFKDGQLIREEKGTRGKKYINGIYKDGIAALDKIFKGKEQNNNYKFVEVEE
ncbi:hypothetical protein LDK30_04810 [Fusobacterium polymorphum]|uniref:Uncharacterized protein n=1 Tax=Fusobacterium nucleatum subsp. polymorphum TaxID=76857 RepID=A0A2C6BGY3_FUSNP|nr:hypothetical protein [Fusobacterium polymorphum]PHI13629.1 hypothetical protein CBG59_08025 [Fusobacterium polymorphum]